MPNTLTHRSHSLFIFVFLTACNVHLIACTQKAAIQFLNDASFQPVCWNPVASIILPNTRILHARVAGGNSGFGCPSPKAVPGASSEVARRQSDQAGRQRAPFGYFWAAKSTRKQLSFLSVAFVLILAPLSGRSERGKKPIDGQPVIVKGDPGGGPPAL